MMAGSEVNQAIALNERKRLSLDRGILFVFLLAGAALIVGLKLALMPLFIRVGIPVSLIVLYACLTIFRTRFRLRYDQVGDNCYYMGFIFTLVSLGVALYQLRIGESVQDYGISVVRDFGLALATTVTGIIFRVTLSQLREDSHDIEEATRRELIEYSRAFSGQMQASVGMLIDVRQGTEDRLKNFAFEMAQIVKEHQTRTGEMRDATQLLAQSVKTLASDLASAEIPTGKLREAAAATIESIALLNTTLERANDGLTAIDAASRQVAKSYQDNSESGAALVRQEASILQARGAGAAASETLTTKIQLLTSSLESAVVATDVFKELATEAKSVTEAMRATTRGIAGANSRLAAAETHLTAQLAAAERTAQSLVAQMELLVAARTRLNDEQSPSGLTVPAT